MSLEEDKIGGERARLALLLATYRHGKFSPKFKVYIAFNSRKRDSRNHLGLFLARVNTRKRARYSHMNSMYEDTCRFPVQIPWPGRDPALGSAGDLRVICGRIMASKFPR